MPDLKEVRVSQPAMSVIKGKTFATPRSRHVSYPKALWASVKNRTTDRYDNDKILIRKNLAF